MSSPLGMIGAAGILDTRNACRVFSQFYSSALDAQDAGTDGPAKQRAFESGFLSALEPVMTATGSYAYAQPDIIVIDGNVVVFQLVAPDLAVFVAGSDAASSPLLLASVLTTLLEALKIIIPGSLSVRSILESFDTVSILFDELIDDGMPLELDLVQLVGRLPRRRLPDGSPSDTPLAEQTIAQAIQTAKYWKETLLK